MPERTSPTPPPAASATPPPGPRLAVGMPVFNGEQFVADAIESLLGQSFTDFELVISDNGSSDATEEIARKYASSDARVRYLREETNRGATWNFNNVLAHCDAPLFKWAAHDDTVAPTFLERCVAALDADPGCVLAFSGVAAIDEHGDRSRFRWRQVRAEKASVVGRFRAILATSDFNPEAVWGVIRRDALEGTRGIGDYAAADHRLLCELALQGRFAEVPEVLFFNRDHAGRSVRAEAEPRHRGAWFDPAGSTSPGLPTWTLAREYATAAIRAPVGWGTRVACLLQFPWFFWAMKGALVRDFVVWGRSLLGGRNRSATRT